jgi:hypothetical protein
VSISACGTFLAPPPRAPPPGAAGFAAGAIAAPPSCFAAVTAPGPPAGAGVGLGAGCALAGRGRDDRARRCALLDDVGAALCVAVVVVAPAALDDPATRPAPPLAGVDDAVVPVEP